MAEDQKPKEPIVHKFEFAGHVKLGMAWTEGEQTSKPEYVKVMLETGDNIVTEKYFNEDGLPTQVGSETLYKVLIEGLSGAIKSHTDAFGGKPETMLDDAVRRLRASLEYAGEVNKDTF